MSDLENLNLDAETLTRLRKSGSVKEFKALVEAEGIEGNEEELKKVYRLISGEDPLTDDELDAITGGKFGFWGNDNKKSDSHIMDLKR